MTSYCAAESCGHPVHSTTLCSDHRAALAHLVQQIPWLMLQLRDAYSRQQRFSAGSGSTPAPKVIDTPVEDVTGRLQLAVGARVQPIGYNQRALTAATLLAEAVTTWQQRLAAHAGQEVTIASPSVAAVWIDQHQSDLATFVDAGHMLDDLDTAQRDAVHAINKPPTKWYAGTCEALVPDPATGEPVTCGTGLYALLDVGDIACARCYAVYDLAERRAALIRDAEDELATAPVIVRALAILTDDVRDAGRLHAQIRQWRSRNHLIPKRHIMADGQKVPMFRVGDVRELYDAFLRREAERAAKRAKRGA